MTTHVTDNLDELAPEPPPHGPIVWVKQNLFYSVLSSVLTVVFGLIGLFAARGFLAFMFDPERRWDAVTKNVRLLMTQAYPAGENLRLTDALGDPINQFHRIWLTVALVGMLLAITFAVFRIGGNVAPRAVGRVLIGIGAVAIGGGLLGPFDATARVIWLLVGAALAAVGYFLANQLGERGKQESIPTVSLIGLGLGVLVVVMWLLKLPVPVQLDAGTVTDLTATAPVSSSSTRASHRATWFRGP